MDCNRVKWLHDLTYPSVTSGAVVHAAVTYESIETRIMASIIFMLFVNCLDHDCAFLNVFGLFYFAALM